MTSADQSGVSCRALAAAIPGCLAVQVGETVTYVAEAFAASGDASAAELAGSSWHSVVPPAAVETVRDGLAAARADGEWHGEVPLEPADGDSAVGVTLRAIDDEAVVWVLDEQDQHQVEGASKGRQRRSPVDPAFAQTLLDVVDDVAYVIGEDGFEYWNERLSETTGYSDEELATMAPRDLVPADQQEFVPGLLEALDAIEDRRVHVDILTKDGDRITHEFTGTTFEDPETGDALRCGIARDVTERQARTAELRRQRSLVQGILNTIPDVVFAFDEAGEPIVEEAMLDEFAGYSGDELADLGPLGVVPEADRQGVLEQIQSVLADGETGSYETDIVAKDGSRIPHEFRAAPFELDGEVLGVVGSARDVSERREREQAIARQRDDLAALDRINHLLLETTREVVQRGNREAVERAACERLADSDLYQFAWVGKQAFDGDRIRPTVKAGEGDGYLDEVTVTAGGDETAMEPAGRAMATGVVQVAEVGGGDDSWRAAASDRGFESAAALPLVHGDTVYGVLAVYATREDAFSPRERAGFDVLGRSVGAVVHAARSRDLLFADAVAELEFRVPDGDSLFHRAARELDCTLSLDGHVAADDEWILYLAVEGRRPAEFVAIASDDDRVERARVISETDAGGRVELVVSESLLHAVSAAGASLQSATATPASLELVVEAPADADVREIVTHVTDEYAAAELVATRERDREITTVGRPGGLVSELTDRQRESLEAAYRAGYFAWPRESTAEEVAASLDLAAPTLHGHLRKAEHQLLAKLFDAGELGGES